MKICEHDLPRAKQRPLNRLRFLHLDDEVGLLKHGCGIDDDLSPVFGVGLIENPAAGSGSRLNDDSMPSPSQFKHTHWQHRNTILILLNLAWNADGRHGNVFQF